MTLLISIPHRKRFDEIRRSLEIIGCKEGSFLKIELLFYEALTLAKAYGDDLRLNTILASLRKVQQDSYEKTREICKTSIQKERLIHHFIVQFKKALSGKLPIAA